MHPSDLMHVPCPICKTDYRFEHFGAFREESLWRGASLLVGLGPDHALLRRQAHFLLVLLPLLTSLSLTCYSLLHHWWQLYQEGPGPPLLIAAVSPLVPTQETLQQTLPNKCGLFITRGWLQGLLSRYAETVDSVASAPPSDAPHPAKISARWSAFYVWSQHVQFCKVLCWMVSLAIGGCEELLPSKTCTLFRIDELLLASYSRCRLFSVAQLLPFMLSKTRHVLVNIARWCPPAQFVAFRILTSHIEIAMTTLTDVYACMAFLNDWRESTGKDLRLHAKLQQLETGRLRVASWNNKQCISLTKPGTCI